MKKFLKNFITILIIIILVLLDGNIYKDLKDFLGSISSSLAAIVALINLFFVAKTFKDNKRDKQMEREISKKSYWFRNIILEKKISLVEKSFDNMLNKIDSINMGQLNDEYARKIIQFFDEERNSILINLVDLIRIMNEAFAENLEEYLLDELEDFYVEKIEDLLTTPTDEYEDIKMIIKRNIIDKKNILLEKLYRYETNNYEFKTHQ